MSRERIFDAGAPRPGSSIEAWQYRLLGQLIARGDIRRCAPDGAPVSHRSRYVCYVANPGHKLAALLHDRAALARLMWPATAPPPTSLGTLGDLLAPDPAPSRTAPRAAGARSPASADAPNAPAAPADPVPPAPLAPAAPPPQPDGVQEPAAEAASREVAEAMRELADGMLALARAVGSLTRDVSAMRREMEEMAKLWK